MRRFIALTLMVIVDLTTYFVFLGTTLAIMALGAFSDAPAVILVAAIAGFLALGTVILWAKPRIAAFTEWLRDSIVGEPVTPTGTMAESRARSLEVQAFLLGALLMLIAGILAICSIYAVSQSWRLTWMIFVLLLLATTFMLPPAGIFGAVFDTARERARELSGLPPRRTEILSEGRRRASPQSDEED